MANEQVEWVSLEDVIVAAEQSFAPMGPELAGFVVLEAALKLRDVGGGILDASNLAIGTTGFVALTAQPKPGDDAQATRTLRSLLAMLLEVSTSSTPALRQCARRKDHAATASLIRELEGALIPLNRAASRRAVARVARATLEAIEDGRLEPGAATAHDAEQSEPPPVELAARPRSEPPPLPARPVPAPVERAREVVETLDEEIEIARSAAPPVAAEPVALTPVPAIAVHDTAEDDRTPYAAPSFELADLPKAAISDLAAALDDHGPAEIEIVSHLPPIVSAKPPSVAANDASPHGRGVYSLRFQPPAPARKSDRVAQLIESFEVSRRRDDPALARDIKAWIGIETATSAPPPVTVHVKLRPRAGHDDDEIAIDHDAPLESSAPVDIDSALPRRRGGMAAMVAMAAIALATGAVAAKPAMLDAIFGAPLPPPGDTAAQPPPPMTAPAPKIPVVCEASLTVDGVPNGSEVLRRIGSTPVTITMPMHVPLDLVATMDGHAPRRAHVDATAMWQKESTGARIDVPFALDAANDAKWPTTTGLVPLRAVPDAPRGLLRATSAPNGASIWIVVDPLAIAGIPCGGAVDLMVVPTLGSAKPLRVEWSAFSGSPPRAAAKY